MCGPSHMHSHSQHCTQDSLPNGVCPPHMLISYAALYSRLAFKWGLHTTILTTVRTTYKILVNVSSLSNVVCIK